MQCKHNGKKHTKDIPAVPVGDELVDFQDLVCDQCGNTISRTVIKRRPK